MCGIVGFIGEHNNKNIIANMLATIKHRGPDSDGIWHDDSCNLFLGHTRLSIVDLTASGHQPMVSDCGNYVLTFNGEIYNHLELRNKLSGTLSLNWKGMSDTETLLKCIIEWGLSKTLQNLTGMYAFALWDVRKRTLSLARDRLGEKPLYYGYLGGSFVFSSEIKAIKEHPEFSEEIDWDSVNRFLHKNYISSPNSIYKNIKKLKAAHYLHFTYEDMLAKNDVEPVCYWSVRASVTDKNFNKKDYNNCLEELDSILTNTIALQSIADVKVGAFLSGGIDSSAVVALLKKNNQNVTTFSIGMPDKEFDESQHAIEIAKHLKTLHFNYNITPDEALKIIDKIPKIWDEPFADSSQIPTFMVSKFAREHVTVALSGDGGDELFMGYSQYPLLKKLWETNALSALPVTKISNTLKRLKIKGLNPYLQRAENLSLAWNFKEPYQLNDFWMDKYRNSDFPMLNDPPISQDSSPQFKDGITSVCLHDLNYYLSDDVLTKVDRASMAVSLETRAPFLDHKVVEFAYSLPTHYKMDNKVQKKILKDMLYKYVDRTLIERPKQGFSLPMKRWLRVELKDWAYDRLKSLPSDKFNASVIEKIWHEHQNGFKDNSEKIWGLCNLANFLVKK
ncbi:asparagine synthase (glutamine-hydrolyzing) [Pantoea sp. OXWO6B1]|uniref:asparagine synthase (glutamine-hydrolyzing) n=1 Tax=Pantoea sp. OXWO6B1 TaxID=1835724 RepID=UPI0007C68306|nr:asparagine synthase (glutamine-hydrolyzing) [Pantoea sp. OXWO6B1]OAE09142.1 hypothetical protein A6A26_16695 [Pantoea sp. OXWO6B1]